MRPAAYQTRLVEAHGRNARRVQRSIVRLGGLFVKVGQLISIMTNFLPEEFRRELESLQDDLPPRPFPEIAARIRMDLGREPSVAFAAFDSVSVASASLAQVHLATTHDGRRVAVKVQHVDIERIARIDLQVIKRVLDLVHAFTRVRGLEAYHREISQLIAEELDFAREADNIERIAARFGPRRDVRFPAVVRELSTTRVLTTEFIVGTKVTDLAELEAKRIDRRPLAERILRAYCQMIFVDGEFHADPHPGNIIVQDDGTIAFVDFGAVGVLSIDMREGLPAFIEGLLKRDTDAIVAALTRMGFIARERDPREIAQRAIEYFQHRFLDDLSQESWKLSDLDMSIRTRLEMLTDLRRLDISFRKLSTTFQVPKNWVVLERTILLLLGLCTYLDASINPMRTIQPYLEEFVLGRDRNWTYLMKTSIKTMWANATALPDELNRLLARSNQGELEIRVPEILEAAALLAVVGRELVYAILATGAGALAFVANLHGQRALAWLGALACAGILALLGRSLLSGRGGRV